MEHAYTPNTTGVRSEMSSITKTAAPQVLATPVLMFQLRRTVKKNLKVLSSRP
jgi:hypothetical protein